MMNAGIGELGREAGDGDDCKMQNAECVTIQRNAASRWNSVILSAAKNPASLAIQARFFAALRMTVVWLVQTAEVLRILLL